MQDIPVLVSKVALRTALAAAVVGGSGPLLANLRIAEPLAGLAVFAIGVALGVVALLLGAVAVWRTWGRRRSARRARLATGIGGLLTAAGYAFAAPGLSAPPINDITTDPLDPPELPARVNLVGTFGYPGAVFADQQRTAYPDLAPVVLPHDADAVFALALAVARDEGWEVVAQDPERRLVRAIDETPVFRFTDDIGLRVREGPSGAIVDLRSRSRVGRGDLGVNAKRIRRFVARLRGRAGGLPPVGS